MRRKLHNLRRWIGGGLGVRLGVGLAVSGALLVTARPVALTLHLIAVPHVPCAEHGELQHGPTPALDGARHRHRIALAAWTSRSTHAHHDCALCYEASRRLAAAAATEPAPPDGQRVLVPRDVPHRPNAARYLLAPKQSPPC